MPATGERMVVSTTKMTAEQYFQLGEDPAGVRLELVDGEIAVSPSPTFEHGYCDNELRFILTNHVKEHNLGIIVGDLDTTLDVYNVRRPDILFISQARRAIAGPGKLRGVPDLAVEIISPSSKEIDRRDKFNQYRRANIHYYWIIDPMLRTLEGYKLTRGRYVSSGEASGNEHVCLPLFPKLTINLSDLWLKPASPRPPRKRNGKH